MNHPYHLSLDGREIFFDLLAVPDTEPVIDEILTKFDTCSVRHERTGGREMLAVFTLREPLESL